jgi:hypothetical protein
VRRAELSPSGRSATKGSPWRIVLQKPWVFQPRIVHAAPGMHVWASLCPRPTLRTWVSAPRLSLHLPGPKTPSGASPSHIGRSERQARRPFQRPPIDDQAATARSSGLMTSSSPPPLTFVTRNRATSHHQPQADRSRRGALEGRSGPVQGPATPHLPRNDLRERCGDHLPHGAGVMSLDSVHPLAD